MSVATAVLVTAVIVLTTAACADAWKWRKWNLFDDGDGDSVVTVAADGRAVYPVYRTYSGYRTVLLRLTAVPDFDPPVITRVRHVYGVPPLPPPPPPPPPATRYGVPAAPIAPPGPSPNNAAATAAAVAAAVARTILEAHGFSRTLDGVEQRVPAPPIGQREAAPPAPHAHVHAEDQGLYWPQGRSAASWSTTWRR